MKVSSNRTNIYIDFQPVENIQEELSKGFEMISSSVAESQEFWKELSEYESNHAYKRTKYRLRQAVVLEVLVPLELADEKINQFTVSLIEEVLGGAKLEWTAYLRKAGQGRYVRFLIAERSKLSEARELVSYAKSNVYRNAETGKLCKATDPDAVLVKEKGTVYKTEMVNWSSKYRMFCIKKNEFIRFINRLRNMIIKVLIDMLIQFSKKHYYPSMKRKGNFNRYVQQHITLYNQFIEYMNVHLESLENMLYSEAHYYQDVKNIDRYNSFFHQYKQRLKTKKFRANRKITLSLSVWNRHDRFMENLETFMNLFDEDYQKTWDLIVNS